MSRPRCFAPRTCCARRAGRRASRPAACRRSACSIPMATWARMCAGTAPSPARRGPANIRPSGRGAAAISPAAGPALVALAADVRASPDRQLHVGDCWTTDAPFRETEESIASCRHAGILAVEMEAASLYAFAAARARPVICFAHVTNQLGCIDGDFEKGDDNGAAGSLDLVMALAAAWRRETQGNERAAT